MMSYLPFTVVLYLRQNLLVILVFLLTCWPWALFRQPDSPTAVFYLHSVMLEFYFGMLIAKAAASAITYPRLSQLHSFRWALPSAPAALPANWAIQAFVTGLPCNHDCLVRRFAGGHRAAAVLLGVGASGLLHQFTEPRSQNASALGPILGSGSKRRCPENPLSGCRDE